MCDFKLACQPKLYTLFRNSQPFLPRHTNNPGACMGRLTTHVLDTAHGTPAAGMCLSLFRLDSGALRLVRRISLDADGRAAAPLLEGDEMSAGKYRLEFELGAYFRSRGVDLPEPAFLDIVGVDFGIADPSVHYHVPLLASPWSYSTYRGS